MSNYIHGAYGKPKGINTTQRIVGKSAYEIAVDHGFVGSEEEWLESLKGKSAYEVAVDLGYEGTADEWVESIGMAMGIDLADELTDLKDDLNVLDTWLDDNDFVGNLKSNALETPYDYETDGFLNNSIILSNGNIRTSSSGSDTQYLLSPLIEVTEGTYGLLVIKHSSSALGDINNTNGGFGLFASDGETPVSKPSSRSDLGNNIHLFEVPSSAKYIRFCINKASAGDAFLSDAVAFFNQWILVAGADSTIDSTFFENIGPKADGTTGEIKRLDGSTVNFIDTQCRTEINNIASKNFGERIETTESITSGYGYNLGGGHVGDKYTSSLTSNNQCAYQVITVEPDTTYYLYGVGNVNSFRLYAILDDNNYILDLCTVNTDYRTSPKELVLPSTAAKIIVNYWNYSSSTDHSMKMRSKKIGSLFDAIDAPLKNKTILLLGDSIFGNDRVEGVADYLRIYTGATVINGAIGGTRICGDTRGSGAYTPFDGENLVEAIINNDWTDQDAAASSVTSYVAAETLPALKAMDIDDVDIVIFNWMSNDYTSNTTAAKYKSAFENVVEMLLTANPKLLLIAATMLWSNNDNGGTDVTSNTIGTGFDAADCTIEVAGKNHIPVIDMYRGCPFNSLTKSVYMDSDYVHPNVLGNQIIAKLLYGKIKTLL